MNRTVSEERTNRMMKTGKRFFFLFLFLFLSATMVSGLACAETAAEQLDDKTRMQFYDRSLIVGDSQVRNLGNYLRRQRGSNPDFFPGLKCYGEYSLQMRMLALEKPLDDGKTVELNYKGRKATLAGIAKAEQPHNIFLMIGLNDRIYANRDRAENYIRRIIALRDAGFPDTDLYFMSILPVTDKWKQKYRDEISTYNEWLCELCEQEEKVYYMDVRAGLADENGCLPKKITTDAESHLNADGFAILVQNLLDFAQIRYEEGFWIPDNP